MTCKDCISYEVCRIVRINGDDRVLENSPCEYFKNKADFVEVDKISPCDVCAYNPPSSLDGKPCALCPAKKKGEIHNG